MQQTLTDDLRIEKTEPLISPAILASSLPLSEKAAGVVADARSGLARFMILRLLLSMLKD